MQCFAAVRRLAQMIALVAFAARAVLAVEPANLLSNGGAEEPADRQEMPPGWFAASVPAPELRMFVDRRYSRAGKACLAIANQHQYGEKVSNNWAQDVRAIPIGKTVRLSGHIRTDDAEAANICLQCWTDGEKRMIAFASTPVLDGTHGWTSTEAAELVVPDGTTRMIARAALTGKGNAYFDDVSLEIVDRVAVRGADHADPPVAGRVVRRLPVVKDCMVLAYLPRWNHGNVDNLGVADNNGGVRTLLAWEQPAREEIDQSHLRYVLAMYSRGTTLRGKPGPIEIHKLLGDWNEGTSWENQPGIAPETAATFEMQPGAGWKLFDVTALVREQARTPQTNRGIALCLSAAESGPQSAWSDYKLVSREAIGEWETRRPVLLVVEPESPPGR